MEVYKYLGGLHSYSTSESKVYNVYKIINEDGTGEEGPSWDNLKDLPVGAFFSRNYENNKYVLRVITEEEIPAIVKEENERQLEAARAAQKIRDDKVATGKFTYEYGTAKAHSGPDYPWIMERQILTENLDEFYEAAYKIIKSQCNWGSYKDMTLEQFKTKKNNYIGLLIEKAQPGDRLEYYF